MKSTFWAFKGQFCAGIPPRLLYSAFTFAQPFLINTVVNYVGQPSEEQNGDHAKGLIGATALLYVGLAVTNAWYKHATFQLLTMYRGSLVSLVFRKTMELDPSAVRESAPVTLMSTDVEGIALGGSSIHDIWASVLELPIALYLLYTHVGVPSLFILVPAAVTTIAGAMISPHMGPAKVIWNKAIQERVGETSSMLSQIKGVKMMGLTEFFNNRLLGLRSTELKLSTKFRWLLVQINGFATASQAITPVVVIVAAIFWTKADEGLSVASAFTSLSIITIASTPIMHILVSLMQLFGVLGCFSRLQSFLKSTPRSDPRQSAVPRISSSSHDSSAYLADHGAATGKQDDLPKNRHELNIMTNKFHLADGTLLKLTDATFSVGEGKNILRDINMEIKSGTLSMVVGRVGCGKSSLLRAMIGELPMKSGSIQTTMRNVAYCDQTPWVINVSIQDNIVGQSEYDKEWLETVISACQLEEDVGAFPMGALTIVGSGGVALSGGQKQRVVSRM
jgi:ABC-type multidrug transport system fused ATPase/permease subunit